MCRALIVGLVALLAGGCREATAPDPLAVSLEAPASVRVGDSAVFILAIQNTSSDTVAVPLGFDYPFEAFVRDSGGALVWDAAGGPGKVTTSVGVSVALPPGNEITLRETWNLRTYAGVPVGPGAYYLEANLEGTTSVYSRNIVVSP